jgi:hypothetical protein
VTEAEFMGAVIDLARLRGWRLHHQRPARTANGWRSAIIGDQGFPDLVLARAGRLVVAELKTERGRLGPGQALWLDLLAAAGAEVHVWRPVDMDAIAAVLR